MANVHSSLNLFQIRKGIASITKATDEALKLLPREINEPINWGDLSCFHAAWCVNGDREYWQVMISEAAPDCPKLHAFIAEELERRGFGVVEVITEW